MAPRCDDHDRAPALCLKYARPCWRESGHQGRDGPRSGPDRPGLTTPEGRPCGNGHTWIERPEEVVLRVDHGVVVQTIQSSRPRSACAWPRILSPSVSL